MWRKMIDWYDELEREQIAVLERPELAAQVPAGWRRRFVDNLAAMSPLERQQLRDFCVTYQGRRLWIASAKLLGAFTVIGVLLHVAMGKGSLLAAIGIANLCGFGLLFGGIGVWFDSRRMMQKKRKLFSATVAGALVGAVATYAILHVLVDAKPLADLLPRLPRLFAQATLAGAVVALPLLIIGSFRRRHHELLTAQLQRDAERERLARELSESQLRMLRAQIEPHFLFNTLGAVQQLAVDGAPRAAELTADLIAFLRASFSDMRCEEVSLAAEFATTESYLRVMQARMGTRLRFSLTLPAPLAQVRVPSMIVLTLVENAIKHGIEPSLRGGEIRVCAEGGAGSVRICVHDSGVGMSDTPGDGAGLDNVRRRLQLAYGEGAGLVLRDAEPGPGLSAELTVPAVLKEAA